MSKKNPINPTRSLFIEQMTKSKKTFLSALIDNSVNSLVMGIPHEDGASYLALIQYVSQRIETPAKMWDAASDGHREQLWDAMISCIAGRYDDLENQKLALGEVLDLFENQDKSLLNEIEKDEPEPDDLEEEDIPDFLYHGTLKENCNTIMRNGLTSMGRKFVHLQDTKDKALEVARRHGSDVVYFIIDTEDFIKSGNSIKKDDFGYGSIWLTEKVLPEFLELQLPTQF